MKKVLVVGCGISGAVVARELAEKGYQVQILEKREHIGGNMYDHVDDYGILVHDYGPHTFHTRKKKLYDYMCKYAAWDEYHLTCGAEINGICTPTPFNYQTIDDFYATNDAAILKQEIEKTFPGRKTVTVVEALNCRNQLVKEYAKFLFDNDYSLYSAKQWGVSPSEIDPSILARVPLRFNYEMGYFDDEYQAMPHISYTTFFKSLINHKSIEVKLNTNALKFLHIVGNELVFNGERTNYPVIYTGPLDELFACCYGQLPYRSLRFEWVHENIDSKQNMPVVAYPQEPDFVRIIEYKKLPAQEVEGTTYEVEYSLPYKAGEKNEPYYPFLSEESKALYNKYAHLASTVENLFVGGRLGDFKYYNMDQALEAALELAERVVDKNEGH